MTYTYHPIVTALLILLSALIVASQPPGSLDPAFGNNGVVLTHVADTASDAKAVAIQPDGKLILGGGITGTIVRYNTNGSLDSSFGTGGIVTSVLISGARVQALGLQNDNKIIVIGMVNTATVHQFVVARYNNNGSLDLGFGTGGFVTTSFGGSNHFAYALVIQPDGKIIVAGSVSNNFALARYGPDGSPDNSFGVGGKVETQFPGTSDFGAVATSIRLIPDGKIVVAGLQFSSITFRDFAVARYNPDGSLDSSFGVGGRVTTHIENNEQSYDSAVQPDGKIILAGTTSSFLAFCLVRYNVDGSLDNTFGLNGKVITQFATGTNFIASLDLQPDGKIIAAGQASANRSEIMLIRYTASGGLDTSFGINGRSIIGAGTNYSNSVSDTAIQADGRIIVAGSAALSGSPSDILLMRCVNDSFGTPTPTPTATPTATPTPTPLPTATPTPTPTASVRTLLDYDGDGKSDISIFRPSLGDWYVQGSQNGLSGIRFGRSTDRIAPADFDGDGKTDVAVYRPSDGVWYIVRSSDNTFRFEVFGLAEDLPVPGDFDADGRADISVFRPSSGTWFRVNSSDGSFFGRQFGQLGDKPVMGDFDGDGSSDLAVYRASAGSWFYIRSSDGSFFGEQFGVTTDQVVPADYDGDRKTDLAVYRASNGFWYIKSSLAGTITQTPFGLAADIPAPGDFDGDGKADLSVFRPSDGQWYRLNSENGSFSAFPFGFAGDRPTQSAFN